MKSLKEFISRNEKLISFILIVIIGFNITSTVFPISSKYTSKDYWERFPAMETIFKNSQYISKKPTAIIPDEVAFSYSAGKLVQGENPVLHVPDAPPLGKYLIGLSAFIFNNENVVIFIFSILSVVLIYFLGFQIFSSRLVSLIPPLLFSSETIFKNQLIYTPLLDLFQLTFLLSSFYFFNKAMSSKSPVKFFLISIVFVGFFISTKFFVSGLSIVFAMTLVLVLRKSFKKLLLFIATLPVSVFILLLSYSRVLAFGYSLRELIGIQKWVFLYHQSKVILPFSVWPLLFFNQWHVWFGDKPVISDPQWSISWPLITIISFLTLIFYLLRKIEHKLEVEILIAWAACYLLFLSVGNTFSRYLFIVIPVLYIISMYGILNFAKIINRKK